MAVELRCVENTRTNDVWRIDVGPTHAVVRGPDGAELTRLTREQAAEVFEFPSFTGSRYFGLRDAARTVRFKVSKEGLRELEAFFDAGLREAGADAVAGLKARAMLGIVGGIAAILAGTGVSIGGYLAAASKPEGGTYFIWWGLPVFGLIALGRGIKTLRRCARISGAGL